jgi:hypothetical protein
MIHRLYTICFVLALSGSLYTTFFGSSVKYELMTKYLQTKFDKIGPFATPDPTKHKIVLLRGVVNKRASSSENAPKHAPLIDVHIDPKYQLLLD